MKLRLVLVTLALLILFPTLALALDVAEYVPNVEMLRTHKLCQEANDHAFCRLDWAATGKEYAPDGTVIDTPIFFGCHECGIGDTYLISGDRVYTLTTPSMVPTYHRHYDLAQLPWPEYSFHRDETGAIDATFATTVYTPGVAPPWAVVSDICVDCDLVGVVLIQPAGAPNWVAAEVSGIGPTPYCDGSGATAPGWRHFAHYELVASEAACQAMCAGGSGSFPWDDGRVCEWLGVVEGLGVCRTHSEFNCWAER